MNYLVKKTHWTASQYAFQRLEIDHRKLLGDILEQSVDHSGPGGLPFPPEV